MVENWNGLAIRIKRARVRVSKQWHPYGSTIAMERFIEPIVDAEISAPPDWTIEDVMEAIRGFRIFTDNGILSAGRAWIVGRSDKEVQVVADWEVE